MVQEEGNIVYLTWDAVLDPEGANVRYIVRLCEVDGDCAELEPVPDVARTLTDTLQGTTYSWKVKAVDETGNEGPYSDEWSFTVANSGGSTPAAGCGCRTHGNTPTPGWLIAGLAALVLRRRRSLRH